MSPKIIAVDTVFVILAAFIIQLYNEGGTAIQLITDDTMIDAVVLPPYNEPAIGVKTFGLAEVLYHTIGKAAMVGQVIIVCAELYNSSFFGVTIVKPDATHRNIITAKADGRVTSKLYFARFLCSNDYWLLGCSTGG